MGVELNRVAIVTGVASGIGLATAKLYGRRLRADIYINGQSVCVDAGLTL